MRFGSFVYLLREGFKNIWHNRLMSMASIGVLTACLILVGVAVLFSMNVNSAIGYVEEQNEVVVFLYDDAQIEIIEKEIEKNENVLEIEFVSKQQAFESQKELLGDKAYLLDGLDSDNYLPNSYIIKLADLSLIDQTVADIYELQGVEQVNVPDEVAQIVVVTKSVVEVVGYALVGVLTLVSLVIIANTIKVTVFNRRKEINIMKYVGATDFFIRLPFIIEGVILGLISSILAYGIILAGYIGIMSIAQDSQSTELFGLQNSLLDFSTVATPLLVGFLLAGVLMGVCGSMLFVRKHLRV